MKKALLKTPKKFLGFLGQPAVIFFTIIGNSILILAVIVVYFLEKNVNPGMPGFLEALWWGVTTITTVGYGDIVPVSVAGRIIGILLMYTGTVLFIAFTGLLATFWVRTEVEREITPIEEEIKLEERETHRIEATLQDIKNRLERLERKGLSPKD